LVIPRPSMEVSCYFEESIWTFGRWNSIPEPPPPWGPA